MKNFQPLLRLLLISLAPAVMLLGLTACSGDKAGETPALGLPQATPTPDPLQGLFVTPTAGLFEFLLDTPTSTLAPAGQVAAPAPAAVVLPQTGADLSARFNLVHRLGSAGLVVAGLLLVAFGLLRGRR